jgi:hypothetical protein
MLGVMPLPGALPPQGPCLDTSACRWRPAPRCAGARASVTTQAPLLGSTASVVSCRSVCAPLRAPSTPPTRWRAPGRCASAPRHAASRAGCARERGATLTTPCPIEGTGQTSRERARSRFPVRRSGPVPCHPDRARMTMCAAPACGLWPHPTPPRRAPALCRIGLRPSAASCEEPRPRAAWPAGFSPPGARVRGRCRRRATRAPGSSGSRARAPPPPGVVAAASHAWAHHHRVGGRGPGLRPPRYRSASACPPCPRRGAAARPHGARPPRPCPRGRPRQGQARAPHRWAGRRERLGGRPPARLRGAWPPGGEPRAPSGHPA